MCSTTDYNSSQTNQWAKRQSNGTHPDRAANWTKNFKKWRYFKGPMVQQQVA